MLRTPSSYHLEGTCTVPNDTTQAWLEIEDADPAHRLYRLVMEPAAGSGGDTPLPVMDDFESNVARHGRRNYRCIRDGLGAGGGLLKVGFQLSTRERPCSRSSS